MYINNNYFDKTFCLTCFNKKRMEHCVQLFNFYNLDVSFWYNPKIPRISRFINNYKSIDYYNNNPNFSKEMNDYRKEGAFMCALGHYNIIKTSYELGYNNILILEDDIAFKNNVNIELLFNSIPSDYDAIQFASFNKDIYIYKESDISPNIFRKFNGHEEIRSTVMYAINRNVQNQIINMYESWLDTADLFWNNLTIDTNIYINTCDIFNFDGIIDYSLIEHK